MVIYLQLSLTFLNCFVGWQFDCVVHLAQVFEEVIVIVVEQAEVIIVGQVFIVVDVVLIVVPPIITVVVSIFASVYSFDHFLCVPRQALVSWLRVCYSFTLRIRKL